MAAVAYPQACDGAALDVLAEIRAATGRKPDHELHFVKLQHTDRLVAAHHLGQLPPEFSIVTVTICKTAPPPMSDGFTDDHAYLWCWRLLLERLSWIARDGDFELDYTMAHMKRFKREKLVGYDEILRKLPGCQVAWAHVPHVGRLSGPKVNERLQLADIAASATWQAFEEQKGFAEPRYLEEMAPSLWVRRGNMLSYGLKIHPRPAPSDPHMRLLTMCESRWNAKNEAQQT